MLSQTKSNTHIYCKYQPFNKLQNFNTKHAHVNVKSSKFT